MASSIMFSGISKSDGTELFRIEPDWWVPSEIGRNVRLKWIRTNDAGSYSDSNANVSIDEARTLHEQFRPRLEGLIEYNTECLDDCRKDTDPGGALLAEEYAEYVSGLKSHLTTLDLAVGRDAEKYSCFQICVFEWDSGL